jgi:hypothetical protein
MWNKLAAKWKLLIIGLGPVVFLLLIFLFVPIMRVSYVGEETYQTTETYYVRESYTEWEPYTVMEPYTAIEIYCDGEPCEQFIPIDYSVLGGEGINYIDGSGCHIELYIKNDDVIGGTFSVEFLIILQTGGTTTISGLKYIEAGEIGTVAASYEGAPLKTRHSYTYSITAPEKLNPEYEEVEVIKYRPVIEYRETIQYRFVPEEVIVLKTRPVTLYKRVSALEYLISY